MEGTTTADDTIRSLNVNSLTAQTPKGRTERQEAAHRAQGVLLLVDGADAGELRLPKGGVLRGGRGGRAERAELHERAGRGGRSWRERPSAGRGCGGGASVGAGGAADVDRGWRVVGRVRVAALRGVCPLT